MHEEQPQKHEMVLIETHPDGSELWRCPVCGHELTMNWPPGFRKTIHYPGDESAVHSGSKGGLKTHSALDTTDDPGLLPWKEWMEKADFRSLWDKEP